MSLLTAILATAAAGAAAPPPAETAAPVPAGETVETLEIVTQRPVVGDLQKGVLDYRPEFFTPVRPATAMDMIRWLPGFTFEDVRDVRGLGGAIGNVLIDGQPPTSKTDSLSQVLARIPSEQVERIDLIVGGAPGIDMRGRQVIANVILKKVATWKGQAMVEAYTDRNGKLGPWATVNLSRNQDGKVVEASLNAGWQLFGGNGVGKGPWVRTDGAGNVILRAVNNGISEGPQVIANGAVEQPWRGGKLRLNGTLTYVKIDFTEEDRLQQPAGQRFVQAQHTEYRRLELGARYERVFGRSTLETQLLERRTSADGSNDLDRPPLRVTFATPASLNEHVARATWRFKRDEALTVESAGELAYNTLSSTAEQTLNGVPTPVVGGLVDIGEIRGEAGGTVTWKPAGRWSLIGALKAEASSLKSAGDVKASKDLFYLKPRLTVSFSPDKDTQLRARIEREVGQIDFSNYVAIGEFSTGEVRFGNPNLRPRRSWVGEAVLERRFWTGASASLTVRRLAIDDVVDLAPVVAGGEVIAVTSNIGDARQTDVVLSVTAPLKALGLNGVVVRGGLTMIHSQVTDPTTGEERRLSNQSALVYDFHLAHDLPRWKANWGIDATYFGGRNYYRPTSFEHVGATIRVNLFAEYRLKPKLTVKAQVWNLTDADLPQTVQVFQGLRGASPLLYTDDRRPGVNPFFYFRVRRAIG